MQAGGPGPGGPQQPGEPLPPNFLDMLNDDNQLFLEFMDPATLGAVVTALPGGAVPPPPDEATRKRIAEQQHDSDGSDDEGPTTAARDAKRSRPEPATVAARNKAHREKARRDKINERFAELASLIDPGGEPKTDKPTILADAIKYVTQLRAENHQLKQLNKFLEERVANYERERGQQLYQHSLLMQQAPSHMMPSLMAPTGVAHHMQMMAPSAAALGQATGSLPGPSSLPPQAMMHPHQMHAAAAAAVAAASAGPSSGPGPSAPPHPAGSSSGQPAASPSPAPGAADVQALAQPSVAGAGSGQLASAGSGGPGLLGALQQQQQQQQQPMPAGMHMQMQMTLPAGLPIGYPTSMGPGVPSGPPAFWVPPSMLDIKQDSLLRPPAA